MIVKSDSRKRRKDVLKTHGKTGGHSLRAAAGGLPLRALRPAGTPGGVRELAADAGDVRDVEREEALARIAAL